MPSVPTLEDIEKAMRYHTRRLNRLQRRQAVLTLVSAGHSIKAVARISGEHRTQVRRWSQKEKKCATEQASKPHEQRDCDYSQEKSVTPFIAFNSSGEKELAVWNHPADHMEAEEIVPPSHANEVKSIALRYLMRMEHRSIQEVADEIGCTKAAISHALCLMSDRLGFKALNSKRRKKTQS